MLAIQYYRQKRGWSQSTLARLAKVSQPRISNIERGRHKPNDVLLNRLAGALGVAPAFSLLRPVTVEERVVFTDSAGVCA